jgi:predicted aspartyl protease
MAAHTALLKEPKEMGRFSIEFEITNYQDVLGVGLGVVPPDKVRRTRVQGVVDTGATRLVLPTSVVQELGLPDMGEAAVRFADGRGGKRTIVGAVQLHIGDRTSVFTAIVEPGRSDALIGAVVLEELDLLADCGAQRLVPRDPRGIVTEIE